jgi:serine/threonine-protein kinase
MPREPAASATLTPPTDPSVEEARAFLQHRLALSAKTGFLLSGGFWLVNFTIFAATYKQKWLAGGSDLPVESIDEAALSGQSMFHLGATVWLAFWWALASRGRHSERSLVAFDIVTTAGAVALLTLMAATIDSGVIGTLIAALPCTYVVVMRAVSVPSSARRTLWVGLLCAAVSVGAMATAYRWAPLRYIATPAYPPARMLINVAIWMLGATAASTIASSVIFGLRQQARDARRIGQYLLLEPLGEGGMGIVYRATHALLRRETAIKLLLPGRVSPATLARFEQEVRQTARLSHPATVAVFDYGRTPDGTFYYAMELVDGLDLEQLVTADGAQPAARVVHILVQILASLAEAHELGLVHRDVKPANVMIGARARAYDTVKVLDFGLVKELRRSVDAEGPLSGPVAGTPLYLSPEAIQAPETVGPASDLYAVAALGYYLLTGTHVFVGRTLVEVCAHHLHAVPDAPSSRLGSPVPPSLEQLLLRGLSKEPAARFASALAMREGLMRLSGVPRWSEADARAWWAETGARLLAQRRGRKPGAERARTVDVDLGARFPLSPSVAAPSRSPADPSAGTAPGG